MKRHDAWIIIWGCILYYEEVAICFEKETPLAQVIFVPIIPLGPCRVRVRVKVRVRV
jgi:hypothetical protein